MSAAVFLILYPIAAALNLFAAAKHNKKLFCITKPALLLLLCLYCLFSGLPTPDYLLIGAFFACWVGDVLLMLKGDIWFTAGGVSFFAGHALLIFTFANRLDTDRGVLVPVIVVSLIYAAAACAVMFTVRKKVPKIMIVPMLLYLICNGVMNAFALLCLIRSGGITLRAPQPEEIRQTVCYALSYAGAALFFLSDCILFLQRYDERPRFYKNDFCVMLTYISAVFLIAVGLVPIIP